MEVFWTTINNINAGGWPLGKIVTVVIILVVTQILRVFLTATVIKRLEHWTSKTESEFDDELIAILKPCLSGLILVGGLWLSKDVLSNELRLQLVQLEVGIVSVDFVFADLG